MEYKRRGDNLLANWSPKRAVKLLNGTQGMNGLAPSRKSKKATNRLIYGLS